MYRKSALPHRIWFMGECHDRPSRPLRVWERVRERICIFIATETDKSSHFITKSHPWSENLAILKKISANHLLVVFIKKLVYILFITIINIKTRSRFVFIWCRSLSEQSVWHLWIQKASDGYSLAASVSCVWLKRNQHQRAYIDFIVVSFLLNFFVFTSNDYQTHYDFPFFM